VDTRPELELFVLDDCVTCRRAEQVVRDCRSLRALVRLVVRRVSEAGQELPDQVVGTPTIMLHGVVVGLGTPDCEELTLKVASIVGARA
jgi:hypothetical protein